MRDLQRAVFGDELAEDEEQRFEISGSRKNREIPLPHMAIVIGVENPGPWVEGATHRRHQAFVPGEVERDVLGAVQFDDCGRVWARAVLQVAHPATDENRLVFRVAGIAAEETGIDEPGTHVDADCGEEPEVPDADEDPVTAASGRVDDQPRDAERPGVCRVDERDVR